MRNHRPLLAVPMGLLLLSSAGCLRSTEQANFYLLEPLSAGSAAAEPGGAENRSRPVVGVGPVKLPGYLNRPQIALAVGQGQIRLDEFRRWSEPLEDNFTRVLAENLRRLLPEVEVVIYPWRRSLDVAVQVEISVDVFHVAQDGNSLLDAQWVATRGGKTELLKQSRQRLPADASSSAGIVAAQSQALAAFSREIAASLRPLLP
ncbi:MAG TPA: PqiC family protein [Methylococcaceae bacterium]|nr:PqiC family protein [Methylococcaceae bacterium]